VPSMTLSESMTMDQFEFLGSEDNLLAARLSRTSIDANSAECELSPPHQPKHRLEIITQLQCPSFINVLLT